MKISIIICVYNGAEFLEKTLNSALVQNYDDFEIVVINDGSTDTSDDILKKYEGGCVRYIKHDTNRGLAAAMNTGIENARGDFIAFLEQDDLWAPNKLDECVDFINKNENCIFLTTLMWTFCLESKKICGLGAGNFSAVMASRDFFDIIGKFNEDKKFLGIEDGDLYAKIAIAKKQGRLSDLQCFSLNKPLGVYVKHEKSLSFHKNLKNIGKKYQTVLNEYEKFESNKDIAELLSFWALRLGYNLMLQNKKSEGFPWIVKSIEWNYSWSRLIVGVFLSAVPYIFQNPLYRLKEYATFYVGRLLVATRHKYRFSKEYQDCLELTA